MIGESNKTYSLGNILSEKEVEVIIRKALGNGHWKLVKSEFKPAAEGISGFMGDHIKGVLYVEIEGQLATVNVFLKRVPTNNKPKADFIAENFFNIKEKLVFSLLEEFEEHDSNPCVPKAYLYTDSLIVLPDLAIQGYSTRHYLDELDLPHVLQTSEAIARFHAKYANYATKKTANGIPYNILNDYGDIIVETTFKDTPWMREAAQLTVNLLATFSAKYRNPPSLESILNVFLEACDSLRDYEDTINVLLHKDLWMNNIMFKYENGLPVNAMLVDFQCMRYGPPTFDLMVLLYLTTSKSFRDKNERQVFRHYYKVFCDSLNNETKVRITRLGYDEQEFLEWCERSRKFGILEALAIFPFVLMDPKTAERTYDDPNTFFKNVFEDRSQPVIAYARNHMIYREKLLAVCEEFVERYVLNDRSIL